MSSRQRAIEKTVGPCAILAGPGTGKTTTLVSKIKFLLEGGHYKPSEVLCLTFSNEATDNIRNRVTEQVRGGSEVTVRTFHGFCSDVLREEGRFVGIDPDFEILQPDDAKVAFYGDFGVRPSAADRYVSTISTAKDFGISYEQVREYFGELEAKVRSLCPARKAVDEYAGELSLELRTMHLEPGGTPKRRQALKDRKAEIAGFNEKYEEYVLYRDFLAAWEKYTAFKRERNYQDFADLTANALELFTRHGAATFSHRYRYVIVDEFQDTNKLQFEVIEHLAGEHRNITVVGDQNQSIYGFRGAYREVFNHFKEAFRVDEGTDIFYLDKSYRSPDAVLKTAHALIQNNYEDPKEAFFVENVHGMAGDDVRVIRLKNSAEEARKVAELVEKEISDGTPLNEVCVLFRTHRQGELLRQALDSKGIPVATAGESNLMRRSEIRTAISYLAIVNNLRERTATGEQAWWSLFHYHNSLTPEDGLKIGRFLRRRQDEMSIDEALLTCLKDVRLSRAGERIVSRVVAKLRYLVSASDKALPDLVLDVYENTGLNRRFTHSRTAGNTEALMNLRLFYEKAEAYWKTHEGDLGGFIKYIEILDDLGVDIQASRLTDVNAVRFMTIHAVKGLEFDTVILTNLAEGRFPITRTRREPLIPKHLLPGLKEYLESLGGADEREAVKGYERAVLLKEERRLCYVGMTRTKKRLFLTYARSYNREEDSTTASVFLREIGYAGQAGNASWENVDFEVDDEEKCSINAPNSEFERLKSRLKDQLIESLDDGSFPDILGRAVAYHAVREKAVADYRKLIEDGWDDVFDREALGELVARNSSKTSGVKFDPKMLTFSPSALMAYDECPKKYELGQVFRMPERGGSDRGAATMGSFVHEVLRLGVSRTFTTETQFLDLAAELAGQKEWEGVDLDDARRMLRVFWKRNAGTYDSRSLCEKRLSVELGGFRFSGVADRIDFLTDRDVRIIDYKTGRHAISPKDRETQLGFYAIAVKEVLGLEPRRLVLEMLKLEKPFVAQVDGSEAKADAGRGFDLDAVKKNLIKTTGAIADDFENEFLPTEEDAPCYGCGFKFYCPKWEER